MAITFALPTWAYSHPAPAGAPPSPWVMLPLGLLPVVIGYGILKHRLFDVEVVVRRGLGYTMLGLVAAALYGGLVAAATTVVGNGHFVTAALVTVAVVLGGSLRSRLQRMVDRRLNPLRFGYLEALHVASSEFAALGDAHQAPELLVRIAVDQGELASAVVFLPRDRIAIDDFGGGYAGLSSFASVQPDLVKFDMGLIHDVDANPLKRRLVQSMLAVCREMGMQVVAEGIERPEQHRVLIELGCRLFQGFLFGRPTRWTEPAVVSAPV